MTDERTVENLRRLESYLSDTTFIKTAEIIATYESAIKKFEMWNRLKEEVSEMKKQQDSDKSGNHYDFERRTAYTMALSFVEGLMAILEEE